MFRTEGHRLVRRSPAAKALDLLVAAAARKPAAMALSLLVAAAARKPAAMALSLLVAVAVHKPAAMALSLLVAAAARKPAAMLGPAVRKPALLGLSIEALAGHTASGFHTAVLLQKLLDCRSSFPRAACYPHIPR